MMLHILWIASWLKLANAFHAMCNISGSVKRIVNALVLYELMVTHTVSGSNKKSSFLKVDNEKRAIEMLNASCIPCKDLLKEKGEKSLIEFNVSYFLNLIPMRTYICMFLKT